MSGCCFSHSAHWLPTRKKLLYTVANPARGLLNRGKKSKEKSGSALPPPHLYNTNSKILSLVDRSSHTHSTTLILTVRYFHSWTALRTLTALHQQQDTTITGGPLYRYRLQPKVSLYGRETDHLRSACRCVA